MQGINSVNIDETHFGTMKDDPFEIVAQNQEYLEYKLQTSYAQVQREKFLEKLKKDDDLFSRYYMLKDLLYDIKDTIIGKEKILDSFVGKKVFVDKPGIIDASILSYDIPMVDLWISDVNIAQNAKLIFDIDFTHAQDQDEIFILRSSLIDEEIVPGEDDWHDINKGSIVAISSVLGHINISSFFSEGDKICTLCNGKKAYAEFIDEYVLVIQGEDDEMHYIRFSEGVETVEELNNLLLGKVFKFNAGNTHQELIQEIIESGLQAYTMVDNTMIIKNTFDNYDLTIFCNNEHLIKNVSEYKHIPASINIDGYTFYSDSNEVNILSNNLKLKFLSSSDEKIHLETKYDYDKIITAIGKFVTSYNSYIDFCKCEEKRDFKGYLKDGSILGDSPEYQFIKTKFDNSIIDSQALVTIGLVINNNGYMIFDKDSLVHNIDRMQGYSTFLNISNALDDLVGYQGILSNTLRTMESDMKVTQENIYDCDKRLSAERDILQRQISNETKKMIQLSHTISLLDMYLDFMTADG